MNRLRWILLITPGVVAIPIVGFGWWLLSPLFIDQSYDLGCVGMGRRRQQAVTAAPALWTPVVVMALTLSVLLGSDGSSIDLPRSVY